ncbi:TIGR03564 family F420-dependent LLM class oxidoreductase [Actinomadura parmotrematis]|uniref:TIGR03564 family F420-dependent LLM class oxidoreductase n=1 Tax=Actinomadura parmotrematis TaxID=2864039 RepID=A0ABS7G2L3_9ACTN|nr:TIGR03564 family F420-dependent LLM class oxidoreductase [Actinomadura parmotrematis]MBW8486959.1 TIGR03564 family F420-dependent LLM class oxidoreductase [Actinomadura parmotrematis]
MSIGAALAPPPSGNAVDGLVALAREAAGAGLRSAWFGQRFDYDAIAVAGLVGREVPGLAVGTSAVPLQPRHPLVIAAQAQTAQAATGGRFRLGLALGAPAFVEPVYGVRYERPAARLREYLTVLRRVADGDASPFEGELVTAAPPMPTALDGGTPYPLLVAALGPQALRVTGELGDGTLPFLAGPRALGEHIVPEITRAAEKAGRPAPRVVAFVAGVVTGDVDAAREAAARATAFYDRVPSYQRAIALSGAERAADLVVAGDAAAVEAAVRSYFDAGATEVVFTQTDLVGREAQSRTLEVLGGLA